MASEEIIYLRNTTTIATTKRSTCPFAPSDPAAATASSPPEGTGADTPRYGRGYTGAAGDDQVSIWPRHRDLETEGSQGTYARQLEGKHEEVGRSSLSNTKDSARLGSQRVLRHRGGIPQVSGNQTSIDDGKQDELGEE